MAKSSAFAAVRGHDGSMKASTMASAISTAAPPNFDGQFFWDGLEQGRLLVQRCTACETLRYPPNTRCEACGATEEDVVEVSGHGTLASYTIVYYPATPGQTLPMTLGLVELDEGVRLMAPLDRAIAQPAVGMRLQAKFGENDLASAPLRFAPEAAD